MNSPQRSYRWLFWTLAVLGLVLDLGSKYVIFGTLYNNGRGDKIVVVQGKLNLTAAYKPDEKYTGSGLLHQLRTISGEQKPHVNEGALFGMGQGKNFLFTVISLVAAVGIIWWSFRRNAAKDRMLTISLGLILAGTVGNLYDRVVFDGVRDFIHWFYLIDWPVFNIADCCLVCGASLLLLQALFFHARSTEDKPSAEASRAESEAEVVELH